MTDKDKMKNNHDQKSPCDREGVGVKEELKPCQEQGRIMTLDEAISMLHGANDYLSKCDWSQSCPCGSCWKCAVQTIQKEISRMEAEVENLIWNLAGCDTFAMGYGLGEPYAENLARPALKSVLKMAQENKKLKAELSAEKEKVKRLREALEKIQKITFDRNIYSYAEETLKETEEK